LYTTADAEAALRLVESVRYHEWVDTTAGRALFSFAGHILGSAHIIIEAGEARVVFSGDIGRWDVPVIKDPEPPARADLVVMESTYGGRHHPADAADPDAVLAEAVHSIIGDDGVMVIPSFAVGRTQEVLYRLRRLEGTGAIPALPVFVDSPMAIDATQLYQRHHEEHDLEMEALDQAGAGPLQPRRVAFTRSVDESKSLNELRGPAIIISASGMATAGRVLHHLKRRLPERRNLVLFVGYQAVGTRGRSLLEGAERVKIHGKWIPVRARVERLDAFSAHADEDELVRWVREAVWPPARVALVHGEPDARQALAERLRSELGLDVVVPRQGASITV
jgi:metallo-beta-lactamase family protein